MEVLVYMFFLVLILGIIFFVIFFWELFKVLIKKWNNLIEVRSFLEGRFFILISFYVFWMDFLIVERVV